MVITWWLVVRVGSFVLLNRDLFLLGRVSVQVGQPQTFSSLGGHIVLRWLHVLAITDDSLSKSTFDHLTVPNEQVAAIGHRGE